MPQNPTPNPIHENPQQDPGGPPRDTSQDPVVDLSAIGSQVLDEAPEVSQEFAREMKAQAMGRANLDQADPDQVDEVPRDSKGFYFDAKYCRVDQATGEPITTASGLWEMKRDKDRKYYKRDQVLKKRLTRPRQPKIPQAQVEIPPDLDQDLGQEIQGEGPDLAALAQEIQTDPQQVAAEKLAALCDFMFWNLSQVVADSSVVQQTQAQMSAPGQAALVEGFMQLDEIPNVPWYAMAGLIYIPALVGMVNHEKSKPKRTKFKEKLATWWIRLRGRNAKILPPQKQGPSREADQVPENIS